MASDNAESKLIGGRYALRRVVGAGATAEVWLAEDTVLHVPRAVKMLRLDARHRESLRRRLRAEALAMSRINHPNVLRVYDVGEDQQLDYIVMDWSARGSLADQVEREGALRPQLAIGYAIQVLSALQAAHHAGVVHRDVKPQNILLDEHGNALLADFGIALVEDPETSPRNTATGAALGSLAYMAPEQRVDARRVDGRADIYATAATLYALITRATPIDLFLTDARSARWNGIPAPLLPVLRRNVSAHPDDRCRDAREMADELRGVLTRLSVDTGPALTMPVWDAPSPVHDVGTGGVGITAPTLADEHIPEPTGTQTLALRRAPGSWADLATPIVILLAMSAVTAGVMRTGTPAPPPPAAAPVAPAPAAIEEGPTPCASFATGTPDGPPPAGQWQGSYGGYAACLVLTGPADRLTGRLRVLYDGNHVDSELRGRYDATTGRVELEDVGAHGDAGSYWLRADDSGQWVGQFQGHRGTILPILFQSVEP